jgi:hypothetical protein
MKWSEVSKRGPVYNRDDEKARKMKEIFMKAMKNAIMAFMFSFGLTYVQAL